MIPSRKKNLKKIVLYSFGQILLIFIGVTTAFWADAWKRSQEEREFEVQILKSLRADLEQTITSWATLRKDDESRLKYLEEIIGSIKNSKPMDSLTDKISGVGRFNSYHPLFTSYETLENKGFDLIRDPKLRAMISFVFSDTYKGWLQSMNSREDKLENEWDSFMRRWFSLGKGDIIFSSDVFMPNSERKQYRYYNTSANFINVLEFSKNSEAMNFLEQRRIRGYENAFIVSVAFDRTKKLSEELKSKGF